MEWWLMLQLAEAVLLISFSVVWLGNVTSLTQFGVSHALISDLLLLTLVAWIFLPGSIRPAASNWSLTTFPPQKVTSGQGHMVENLDLLAGVWLFSHLFKTSCGQGHMVENLHLLAGVWLFFHLFKTSCGWWIVSSEATPTHLNQTLWWLMPQFNFLWAKLSCWWQYL